MVKQHTHVTSLSSARDTGQVTQEAEAWGEAPGRPLLPPPRCCWEKLFSPRLGS